MMIIDMDSKRKISLQEQYIATDDALAIQHTNGRIPKCRVIEQAYITTTMKQA